MLTYEQCKKLKDLGFKQKHNRYSKYYLTSDYIIDFETAHSVFQNIRQTNDVFEEIEWTKSLVYIPTLEDFIGQGEYELKLTLALLKWLEENEKSKD